MILKEFSNLNDPTILIIYILIRPAFFIFEAFWSFWEVTTVKSKSIWKCWLGPLTFH